MKRKLLLLVAVMLFSTATISAQSGKTGPLTWNLENDTLTISGKGVMPDYKFHPPWAPSFDSPIYRANL